MKKSIEYSEICSIISNLEKQENENYYHYTTINPDDIDIHNDHIMVLGTYCRVLHTIKNYMEDLT